MGPWGNAAKIQIAQRKLYGKPKYSNLKVSTWSGGGLGDVDSWEGQPQDGLLITLTHFTHPPCLSYQQAALPARSDHSSNGATNYNKAAVPNSA